MALNTALNPSLSVEDFGLLLDFSRGNAPQKAEPVFLAAPPHRYFTWKTRRIVQGQGPATARRGKLPLLAGTWKTGRVEGCVQ